MRNLIAGILTVAIATIALTGCSRSQGPYRPVSRPPALENTETAVIESRELRKVIGVEGQQSIRLTDNRLRAQANVRNLSRKPVQIQISTVFKDAQAFSINDETNWETYLLTENETRTYFADSIRQDAQFYTIRIRSAR